MKEVRPLPRHHARIFAGPGQVRCVASAAAEFPPPNGSDLPSLAAFTVITRHDRLCREDGRSMREVLWREDKFSQLAGTDPILVIRGPRTDRQKQPSAHSDGADSLAQADLPPALSIERLSIEIPKSAEQREAIMLEKKCQFLRI